MGLGNVEVIKFHGSCADSKKGRTCSVYLVTIDGQYLKSYGTPNFEFNLPEEWISRYQIATYEVGFAPSWKEFFGKCAKKLAQEDPLDGQSADELLRDYLADVLGSGELRGPNEQLGNESTDVTIDRLAEQLL